MCPIGTNWRKSSISAAVTAWGSAKSPGTEDNSGDYNVYAQEETLEISGNAVTLKGGNGAYSLAIWTDGSYAYSISVTDPLSRDAFRALLEENF